MTATLYRGAPARKARRRRLARRASWALAILGAVLVLGSLGTGLGLLFAEAVTR